MINLRYVALANPAIGDFQGMVYIAWRNGHASDASSAERNIKRMEVARVGTC